MHTIEVDNDVMRFLKERAEPFVDTPNQVLRRELLGDGLSRHNAEPGRGGHSGDSVPSLPAGTPAALEQILQVTILVSRDNLGRTDATKIVARHHGVAVQTVNDKYGRQIGLNAFQFDKFLAQTGLHQLRRHLVSQFPEHHSTIMRTLEYDHDHDDISALSSKTNESIPNVVSNGNEEITQTTVGFLKGRAPNGESIVVWHRNPDRTGYRVYRNGKWFDRFEQDEMENRLGIPVRIKSSGGQQGYPSEPVTLAAWRYLLDLYRSGDKSVEFSRSVPNGVRIK